MQTAAYILATSFSFESGAVIARYPGWIVEWPGLPADVYIDNPPLELRKHEHGSCFQLAKPNSSRFKLHWRRAARSFDEALTYMQQLLDESVGSKRVNLGG